LSTSFGGAIYYDENPYLGYKNSYSARLTFKPLTNLRYFLNLQRYTFYKSQGGEKVYSVNIVSQRLTYQMSKPLSARLIADYNDYDRDIYLSALLSYELRPGTVFYLGVEDNQLKDESGIFRTGSRYYFIKFSYWWRM